MNFGHLLVALSSFYGGAKALQAALDDGESDNSNTRRRLQGLNAGTPNQPGDRYEDRPMTVETHKVRTINQRLGYIIKMIQKGRDNPEVRRRTVQILSRKCGKKWCVPEKNWRQETVAVFDSVRENIRYTRDTYNKDLFQHPLRTFEFGGGDCDDYAIVLASMLQSVGYPVKLRVIQTVDSTDWNHIYVLVGLPPQGPKQWVSLDASVDKPAGWQAPRDIVAAVKDFEVP